MTRPGLLTASSQTESSFNLCLRADYRYLSRSLPEPYGILGTRALGELLVRERLLESRILFIDLLMRLKLIIFTSLLAALVGSGASIAIVLGAFSSLKPLNTPGVLVLSTFLLPAGAIVWATVFVYRHTARRRKLQATMTALLGLLLALGTFTATVVLTSRAGRVPAQPTPPPHNVG